SIPVKKRLDEGTLTNNLKRHGVTTTIHQNSDGILQTLVEECKPGDVVVIMSNGSFGNLHQRLLQALELLKK
ncbi:MAG TPA: UDP-N-acetylmuramate:L-alanyl-gamma-D-glutamyl-meso-diaminopimelate ligase, partial [SAR324 cluster bacterium]|nr:UDP-N-acetylmuramate:L-alanyl-gamma-D-glutamyl-meso-diaminopimelate ligase [SAR324 cluster bacterium]